MPAHLGEEAPQGDQLGPQAAQAGLHGHMPHALPVRPAHLLQERPAGARARASHALLPSWARPCMASWTAMRQPLACSGGDKLVRLHAGTRRQLQRLLLCRPSKGCPCLQGCDQAREAVQCTSGGSAPVLVAGVAPLLIELHLSPEAFAGGCLLPRLHSGCLDSLDNFFCCQTPGATRRHHIS